MKKQVIKSFISIDEMVEYIQVDTYNINSDIEKSMKEIDSIPLKLREVIESIIKEDRTELGIMPEKGDSLSIGRIIYTIGVSYIEYQGMQEYSYWILSKAE